MRAVQAAVLLGLSENVQAAPLQYLSGAGQKAAPVVTLTWGVLLISVAVVIIIAFLLAGAIWHRPSLAFNKGTKPDVGPEDGGLNWLWIGVGLSTLALLFTVVWTVKVLAEIARPPNGAAITIEITGKQWWWQARYLAADPSRQFTTANEIHIPAGQPVRLKLVGGDVIHSFWVPQLAGKMDAIPGQTNETWIEADQPGIYQGQCTEFCGVQHAHMALVVVAEEPVRFQRWWTHQLEDPPPPQGVALVGQQNFQIRCGSCHAVRGTEAAGALGPDLSHLMLRHTLAAGTVPNAPSSLAHWVSDPQSLKPGSLMPAPQLSDQTLSAIHAYLNTLD